MSLKLISVTLYKLHPFGLDGLVLYPSFLKDQWTPSLVVFTGIAAIPVSVFLDLTGV